MVTHWTPEKTRFYRPRLTSDNGFRRDLLNISKILVLSVRNMGFENHRSRCITFRFVVRINGLKRRRSKHSLFPGVLVTAAEQTGNIVADNAEEYYYNYYI